MGTAGLEIPNLRKLLNRQRVELELLQDDSFGDFCVLRLTDARYPHYEALLRYENIGLEPRIVELSFKTEQTEYKNGLHESEILNLAGRRKDDPKKIAAWITQLFRRTEKQNVKE
jgi:hypothetical protein